MKMSACALVMLFCAVAQAGETAPLVQHVIVIGVDGMSVDGVAKAPTPRMHGLMKSGSWTLHARGVFPTSSSPNWMSMISGATPEQHGVTDNKWQPDQFDITSISSESHGRFPTMFGVLRAQVPGAIIGVFHDWKDFGRLIEPGVTDVTKHEEGAAANAAAAIAYLHEKKPTLLFLHLDHVDHAGHGQGWATPEYYAAVAEADRLIGTVVDAVAAAGLEGSTAILVTADHGGSGKKHGNMLMSDLEIPWILRGPCVKKDHELKSPVNTYDTAATVALLLGVKQPEIWIGRAVREAISE